MYIFFSPKPHAKEKMPTTQREVQCGMVIYSASHGLVVKFPILRAFTWHACRVIVTFASDKEVLHTPSLPLAKKGWRDNKEKNL